MIRTPEGRMSRRAWTRYLDGDPVVLQEERGDDVAVSVAGQDHILKAAVWQALPPWPSGVSVEDARKIHRAVREAAGKLGFEEFEVGYGEDWTGDAAVWIWFPIPPDYPTDKDSISRLTDLSSAVKDALFEAGIDRLPYVNFKDQQAVG